MGLWWKPQADEGGTGTWTQANSQATLGETNNYYQVNWVRETGTYEIVFNVEVVEPMSFNFGRYEVARSEATSYAILTR